MWNQDAQILNNDYDEYEVNLYLSELLRAKIDQDSEDEYVNIGE